MPRASSVALEEAASLARLAAEALSTNGISIRYIRTTYLADDESCFHFFEANSTEDVAQAARRVGLPSGRITRAVEATAASASLHAGSTTRGDLHPRRNRRE
jgi:acid phosphatase class B